MAHHVCRQVDIIIFIHLLLISNLLVVNLAGKMEGVGVLDTADELGSGVVDVVEIHLSIYHFFSIRIETIPVDIII